MSRTIERMPTLLSIALLVVGTLWQAVGTRHAQDHGEAVLRAAVQVLNGVPSTQCSDDGLTPPVGVAVCISSPAEALASAPTGLVRQAWHGADIQPQVVLMGRAPDDTWGLWFTAPATVVPVALPAQARVCAAGGLHVRQAPALSAAVIGGLAEGDLVDVEAFVLQEPGMWNAEQGGAIGQGWYQITGAARWVAGQYLIVADGDCVAALTQ